MEYIPKAVQFGAEFSTKIGGAEFDAEIGAEIGDFDAEMCTDSPPNPALNSIPRSKFSAEIGIEIDAKIGAEIDTKMGVEIDTEIRAKMGVKIDTEIETDLMKLDLENLPKHHYVSKIKFVR